MTTRKHGGLCAAALGTAYVLTMFVPRPAELARGLSSPEAWVAKVGPDAAAGALAGALLWLLALWIAFAMAATVLSLLPGQLGKIAHAVAVRVTPAVLRRVVIAAAGTSILTSPVAAFADSPAGTPPPPTANSAPSLPSIGWPTDPDPAISDSGDSARQATGARVAVRPGDSLWSIAAHRLGSAASEAQIQAEWPRWYEENRQQIGADPNLLQPGASLLAPPATPQNTEE